MDIFWNHTIYFENSERRTVYTARFELHKDFCFQLFLGLFICKIGQQCDKISAKTAESSWVNKLYVASG